MSPKWKIVKPKQSPASPPLMQRHFDEKLNLNVYQEVCSSLMRRQGHPESQQEISRLVYTLSARRALASLFDSDESQYDHEGSDGSVSLHHFKKAFLATVDAASKIWGLAKKFKPNERVADDLVQLYSDCGYVLRRPNRIRTPEFSFCRTDGLFFVRGAGPGFQSTMSGAGMFTFFPPRDMPETGERTLSEFFGFPEELPSESFLRLIERLRPNCLHTEGNDWRWEYLKRSKIGYAWQQGITNIPNLSLARAMTPGGTLYFLTAQKRKSVYRVPLPEYLSTDIPTLAVGVITLDGNRPQALAFHSRDGLTQIQWSYLPPLPLRRAWQLYSWPLPPTNDRIIETEVFKRFVPELIRIGFEVKEYRND